MTHGTPEHAIPMDGVGLLQYEHGKQQHSPHVISEPLKGEKPPQTQKKIGDLKGPCLVQYRLRA